MSVNGGAIDSCKEGGGKRSCGERDGKGGSKRIVEAMPTGSQGK